MKTLRSKITFWFASLAAFLIIIITMVSYETSLYILKKNMSFTLSHISDQSSQNINHFLGSLVNLSMLPLYDGKINQILADPQSPDWKKDQDIEDYLRSYFLYNHPEISAVHLVLANGSSSTITLFKDISQAYSFDINQNGWLDKAKELNGKYLLTNTVKHPENGQAVFSLYRQLVDSGTRKPYAVLVLDVKTEVLGTLFSAIHSSDGLALRIVNDQSVIFSTLPGEIAKPVVSLNMADWIAGSPAHTDFGWEIVSLMDIHIISHEAIRIRLLIMSISVLVILVLFLLFFWLSKRITQPLMRLQRMMGEAQKGNFHLRFHDDSSDEISSLGNSFNAMLEKIEQLISSEYISKIRQKEAEIKSLQNQIKPHFLFNSLESIRMAAEIEENTQTVKMVIALGKILKENFIGRKSITIQQEIDIIQSYLYLQSQRLSRPLVSELYCEPDLLGFTIPPFLIQPLVENAVQHGIRGMQGEGVISVRIERAGENLEITVRDNGKGIEPDTLQQIRYNIGLPTPPQTQGIGLWNVNQRIIHMFHTKIGVSIISDNGVTVRISIPLNGEDEGMR